MLKDEFDELVRLFEEGVQGHHVNLSDVFARSLQFFEHLKVEIANGTPEEKAEAMNMMADLYKHMTEETKKISERSGLSEDQLLAYADNPSNFTPDQWQMVQESKEKIAQAGSDLAKLIYDQGQVRPQDQEKKEGARSAPIKRSKRSQWLRS